MVLRLHLKTANFVVYPRARALGARLVLFGFVSVITLGGCAAVAPYERELLASPAMQLESDSLAAEMEQHTHDYREGVSGGFGGAGGGCGCN